MTAADIVTTDAPAVEKTDSEKIAEMHEAMMRILTIVEDVKDQVGPTLEAVSSHPMLKMFLR